MPERSICQASRFISDKNKYNWIWEKCGNQRHGFWRNVEINDMVLGSAKWSELCGAKTPMMQRKGDKSQGEIAFQIHMYTQTTNTQIHKYINFKEGDH